MRSDDRHDGADPEADAGRERGPGPGDPLRAFLATRADMRGDERYERLADREHDWNLQ
jgi:hypothetical protein